MVVLGGDGTILRGAEWVLDVRDPAARGEPGSRRVPGRGRVVGDRQHRRSTWWTARTRSRSASPSTVTLRDCESGEVVWSSYAINEVSIEKAARERMLEVLVEIDGRPLSRWACDGMLVATPTGSTAYAFSAGGPVVWPGVDALLVVPLSAHALFARPMVLSPTSTVIGRADRRLADRTGWCGATAAVRSSCGPGWRSRSTRGAAPAAAGPAVARRRSPTGWCNKFGLRVEGWRGSAEPPPTRCRDPDRPMLITELRIADLGVINEAALEPAPGPDRGHRRDRGGQDHDRHRPRTAAGRPGRPAGRPARRRAGPGRGPVPGVADPTLVQRGDRRAAASSRTTSCWWPGRSPRPGGPGPSSAGRRCRRRSAPR